jgi:hypothetical protein
MMGFVEFGPQNSAVTVPEGISGGMWCHSEGCVSASCGARGRRIKTLWVGPF